jgi:hypothetical protein
MEIEPEALVTPSPARSIDRLVPEPPRSVAEPNVQNQGKSLEPI